MAFLTAAKKVLLKKSSPAAYKAGLGDLLGVNVAAAGTFTTAGGDANESIPVTGAASGDIAIVTVKTNGSTPRTVVTASVTTNAITVVLSGDPSTDHVLQYVVIRNV